MEQLWLFDGREIANRDFYDDGGWNGTAQSSPTSPFNETSGTGFGALADRPTTCTAGVGYWATDQGSWNGSSNTYAGGYSQRELFTCTATNTWTATYEPYTYPDPLIGGGGGPAPAAPWPSMLLGSAAGDDHLAVDFRIGQRFQDGIDALPVSHEVAHAEQQVFACDGTKPDERIGQLFGVDVVDAFEQRDSVVTALGLEAFDAGNVPLRGRKFVACGLNSARRNVCPAEFSLPFSLTQPAQQRASAATQIEDRTCWTGYEQINGFMRGNGFSEVPSAVLAMPHEFLHGERGGSAQHERLLSAEGRMARAKAGDVNRRMVNKRSYAIQ